MKIVSMTKVKNEADIIESFVRYHMSIFDEMYFIENGSSDGTVEILKKLMEEGLPVYMFDECGSEFQEFRFANEYMYRIQDIAKPEWIVPLDADEFLCARSKDNPRSVIETLPTDKVICLKWRTYICSETKKITQFMPKQFLQYRNEEDEIYKKVIVSTELLERKAFMLNEGYHDFEADEKIDKVEIHSLFYAHYPVRGIEQIRKQVLINGINMMHNGNGYSLSSHWKEMYSDIKDGKVDLEKISGRYTLQNEVISIYEGMINLGFCGDTSIRYSHLANMSVENNLIALAEDLAIKKRRYELMTSKFELNEDRMKIIVFGTGRECIRKLKYIDKRKYEIVAFTDSDIEKVYGTFEGKMIVPLEKIGVLYWDKLVIASTCYFDEMKQMACQICNPSKVVSINTIVLEGFQNRENEIIGYNGMFE